MELCPKPHVYTHPDYDAEIHWSALSSWDNTQALQAALVMKEVAEGVPPKAKVDPVELIYARVAMAIRDVSKVYMKGEEVVWSSLDRGGKMDFVHRLPDDFMNGLQSAIDKASTMTKEDERSPSESPAE